MSIKIEDLTIKQVRDLSELFSEKPTDPHPYRVGKSYIIRTVTMITIGRLVAVHANEIVLIEASWIPETGRYKQFIADGMINECEPYPEDLHVIVGRGSIIDCCEWRNPLPREQK